MYKESPITQRDVEPKEPSQIDEDEDTTPLDVGLVGTCLIGFNHEEFSSSIDEEGFV